MTIYSHGLAEIDADSVLDALQNAELVIASCFEGMLLLYPICREK